MMYPLSENQNRALRFIDRFMRENKWAPSYTEIRKELGVKQNATVYRILFMLSTKGYIYLKGSRQMYVMFLP